MIRYALVCDNEHEFQAWFASSATYDVQSAKGHVSCPHCGSPRVSKSIMAPNVATGKKHQPAPSDVAAAARKIREYVAQTSEYVGPRFADEARKIHNEESGARNIYGSATSDEAKALRDEGVEFSPLPPLPEEQN